jgi:hypothetical protein
MDSEGCMALGADLIIAPMDLEEAAKRLERISERSDPMFGCWLGFVELATMKKYMSLLMVVSVE